MSLAIANFFTDKNPISELLLVSDRLKAYLERTPALRFYQASPELTEER